MHPVTHSGEVSGNVRFAIMFVVVGGRYGQLSGLVEPLAGVLGCITVQYVHPLQPYALGFAAGAMIFVIFDDVIPEAHRK